MNLTHNIRYKLVAYAEILSEKINAITSKTCRSGHQENNNDAPKVVNNKQDAHQLAGQAKRRATKIRRKAVGSGLSAAL